MTNVRDPRLFNLCLVVAFASICIAVGAKSKHVVSYSSARIQRLCKSSQNPVTSKKRLCKILNSGAPVMNERKFENMWGSLERSTNAGIAKRTDRKCPDFTLKYLQRQNDLKMRSISPFGPIEDYNPTRRPRVIIHQACLCQHCFSLPNLEPNPNLASYNITTKMNVAYNNGTSSTYDVITGCTCVVPNYQSASM